MAIYLDEDWFADYVAAAEELPEHAGLDLVINVEVSASPAGKVRYFETWKNGRLVSAELGKSADAEVGFVLKYTEAKAMVGRSISEDVAFMQGRFKIDASYEKWLYEFRPVTSTDAYQSFRDAVAELTEFA